MLLKIVLPGACLVSIIHVNTVPTLGPLIFDYRHVFGVRIVCVCVSVGGEEGGLVYY